MITAREDRPIQSSITVTPGPGPGVWVARILWALVVLFLAFDGAIHLLVIAPVVEASHQLGYPVSYARVLGLIELASLALYLVPRTSILGAILLTGYLGGAVAVNLRVGNPLFSHVLFPAYLGTLIWTTAYLRDSRVRTLITAGRWPHDAV